MRRFRALLDGLPLQSLTWAPERLAAAKPQPPIEKLRRVSPLEALRIVRGGVHARQAR